MRDTKATSKRLAFVLSLAVLGWSSSGGALANGDRAEWPESEAAMGLPIWQTHMPVTRGLASTLARDADGPAEDARSLAALWMVLTNDDGTEAADPVPAPRAERSSPEGDDSAQAAADDHKEIAPQSDTEPRPLGRRLALADEQLEQVRGGFEAANGLMISFGIERAVYINGELVTTTSLTMSDRGTVSTGQAGAVGVNTAGMTLIQNGPGNTFLATPSASSIGTVIQNTLNNQKIQNVTAVNAVVNSAQIFKGLSLQSTLSNALTSALRR